MSGVQGAVGITATMPVWWSTTDTTPVDVPVDVAVQTSIRDLARFIAGTNGTVDWRTVRVRIVDGTDAPVPGHRTVTVSVMEGS